MTGKRQCEQSVIDVQMAHRSVRGFTDEAMDAATLRRLVEVGTRASTSSNMQAYTVISITDSALKTRLAGFCSDQKQIHESAAFCVFCADLHKLLLACTLQDVSTRAAGQAEALLVAVVDVALVMQNVAIAAESLGYGICMIGAMRNHPHQVAEALHLPKNVMAIAGLCIGRPSDNGEVKPRIDLDATLHVNRYRSDEELVVLLRAYDEQQARWYQQRGMHTSDARWTAVMAKRLPAVEKREAVGRFLKEQGFLAEQASE